MSKNEIEVHIESGKKKVFTCAVEWPGWVRSAQTESAAVENFLAYAPRYSAVLNRSSLIFNPSADVKIIERIEGNATTDFGAPNMATRHDADPITPADLDRFKTIMSACWAVFEQTVRDATGYELQKGPRGGGRNLDQIVNHVFEAEKLYLARINRGFVKVVGEPPVDALRRIQAESLEALTSAVENGLPEKGSRGSQIWLPRTYVHRSAWHVLDHVWEIEDKVQK
ncbi:MAG: hypothetical protein ACI9EW_003905 [Cellvibrionaceae bacterium]|jgi:hypothetical protein